MSNVRPDNVFTSMLNAPAERSASGLLWLSAQRYFIYLVPLLQYILFSHCFFSHYLFLSRKCCIYIATEWWYDCDVTTLVIAYGVCYITGTGTGTVVYSRTKSTRHGSARQHPTPGQRPTANILGVPKAHRPTGFLTFNMMANLNMMRCTPETAENKSRDLHKLQEMSWSQVKELRNRIIFKSKVKSSQVLVLRDRDQPSGPLIISPTPGTLMDPCVTRALWRGLSEVGRRCCRRGLCEAGRNWTSIR